MAYGDSGSSAVSAALTSLSGMEYALAGSRLIEFTWGSSHSGAAYAPKAAIATVPNDKNLLLLDIFTTR